MTDARKVGRCPSCRRVIRDLRSDESVYNVAGKWADPRSGDPTFIVHERPSCDWFHATPLSNIIGALR